MKVRIDNWGPIEHCEYDLDKDMSESQFNYTVIEKMHKSPIWDNHILKVRVRGKDKIYVLKLYGGINEPFQKLVFNREIEDPFFRKWILKNMIE